MGVNSKLNFSRTESFAGTDVMSFQVGIGCLGGAVFFQLGLCTPLRTMGRYQTWKLVQYIIDIKAETSNRINAVHSSSDISRTIFISAYRHGCPNSSAPKIKYVFIYTIILDRKFCFILSNLSEVYFYVRKHTFSIVNHPTFHQHFNMDLLCAVQPL